MPHPTLSNGRGTTRRLGSAEALRPWERVGSTRHSVILGLGQERTKQSETDLSQQSVSGGFLVVQWLRNGEEDVFDAGASNRVWK